MGEEEVEKTKKILWRSEGALKGAFLSFRTHIFLELEETGWPMNVQCCCGK